MKMSSKMERCGLSPMRKFNPAATEAEARGLKIYHLNIGQPDVKTPAPFYQALKEFNDPVVAYAPAPGVPVFLDAVRALYGSGSLRLYDKGKPEQGQPQIELDGFINGDHVELIAGRVEAAIGEMLRKGQRSLETTDYADIYRALAKRGMIRYKQAPDGAIGACKINTKFKGNQLSCIHLYLWALSGDTPEQAKELTADDFTQTDAEDPFEKKS